MKIQPINAIEGALLQTRFAEMPLDRLTDAVGAAMQISGIVGGAAAFSQLNDRTTFSVGDYYVCVVQKSVALPREGLGGCLPQPITKIMMPDAEQRVAAHCAHVFVSVTRSPLVASLDVDEEGYSFGDFRTSDDAFRAMTLGYHVLHGLHRYNPATAIHWLASDHLVSPFHFEAAAEEPTLTRFFIRPYLYSSAGTIAAGSPIGLVANGSQYLMDKSVIFDEAPVDYRWLIDRCGQFIDEVLAQKKIPSHGAGFAPKDEELFEVFHCGPEVKNPVGSYLLVVRNAPQFGIRGGLNLVLSMPSDEDLSLENINRKLDASDPIDLAILNALKSRSTEMCDAVRVPVVKDRRMGPRQTHEIAQFGRRTGFGKR